MGTVDISGPALQSGMTLAHRAVKRHDDHETLIKETLGWLAYSSGVQPLSSGWGAFSVQLMWCRKPKTEAGKETSNKASLLTVPRPLGGTFFQITTFAPLSVRFSEHIDIFGMCNLTKPLCYLSKGYIHIYIYMIRGMAHCAALSLPLNSHAESRHGSAQYWEWGTETGRSHGLTG